MTVHIAARDGRRIARFRLHGRQVAETLGADDLEATAKLVAIISALNEGRYLPPRDRAMRVLPVQSFPRLTLRDLIGDFLADKRASNGKATAATYTARLGHVLAFLESPGVLKRWPHARRVDREFVIEYQRWLFGKKVTPNGRPGATPRRISSRGVYHALETLRNALHWGCRPQVGRLPTAFVNPVTADVLGERPRQDPLRECPLTLQDRIRLAQSADAWELCALATCLVLPPRGEELAGLLASEVDFERRRLRFGTRMGGDDYTKGKTDFLLPFPAELTPLLLVLKAGRSEGPLLRPRRHYKSRHVGAFADHAALSFAYEACLARQPKKEIMTRGDRKDAFRRFLVRQGGLSQDSVRKAFYHLQQRVFGEVKVRFHDLRHAATDGMDDAGVADQARRYMTGHKCGNDIMDNYTTVKLEREAAKYFASIRPLLDAVSARSKELGLTDSVEAV